MFRPFTPPSDVNKYGVARSVQRVGLEQSAHDKQPYAQELSGFGDGESFLITKEKDIFNIPIGPGSACEPLTTAKDVFNVLVSAGSTYLETEKQKAEAEKLQAQAAATQAAVGLKTAQAGMGTATPWMIAALILGAVVTLGGRKKR